MLIKSMTLGLPGESFSASTIYKNNIGANPSQAEGLTVSEFKTLNENLKKQDYVIISSDSDEPEALAQSSFESAKQIADRHSAASLTDVFNTTGMHEDYHKPSDDYDLGGLTYYGDPGNGREYIKAFERALPVQEMKDGTGEVIGYAVRNDKGERFVIWNGSAETAYKVKNFGSLSQAEFRECGLLIGKFLKEKE